MDARLRRSGEIRGNRRIAEEGSELSLDETMLGSCNRDEIGEELRGAECFEKGGGKKPTTGARGAQEGRLHDEEVLDGVQGEEREE